MKRVAAHVISWVFNPGCLLVGLLMIGVFATRSFSSDAIVGWLVALILISFIATTILFIAWARGTTLDADLMTPVNLSERSQVLLIFMSLILLMLIASFRLGQQQPFHALLVGILLLGLTVAGISLFWKISLHMMGVGMLFTAGFLMLGSPWWPVAVLIPLIGWARLRLHRHTIPQISGGLILGAAITLLVFELYHLS